MRQLLERSEHRPSPVEVRSLVGDAVDLVRSEAISRGVAMHARAPRDGLPAILGDEIQLKQVLLNLLLNAIDAAARSTADPRAVAIDAEELDGDVVISVRDTGPGLPAGDPTRLFEPFVSTRPEGLGMGLTICRTIVDAHGGRIWAEPNHPSGAVFAIRLQAAGGDPAG